MNKPVKIILTVIASILVIYLGMSAVNALNWYNAQQNMPTPIDNNPKVVAKVGQAIADYTLPAGFGNGYAVTAADLSLVTYSTADDRSHIYLVQMAAATPSETDLTQAQMDMTVGTKGWTALQVIERQPCHIRGEASTLIVSEGVSHDGLRYRSASAIFSGKKGTALVSISAPSGNWDQALVETFIASIH